MKFDNVTHSRKLPDGAIELTISDPISDQPTAKERFAAIRGGVSWPTPEAPAYFCVVGQLYKDPDAKEAGERLLMAEYQSDSFTLTKFYDKLLDAAVQLNCQELYSIIPENRSACGFTHDFTHHCSEHAPNIYLSAAYDPDNFMLGMSRIRESLENASLSLPDDSVIKLQLLGLTREDVEGKPEDRFHAINGLRHVLGSFYRYEPVNRKSLITRRSSSWRTV